MGSLKTQIFQHLRFLSGPPHGCIELMSIALGERRRLATGFFGDENAFVHYCRKYNQRGANIYVGCNPRSHDLFETAPNQMVEGLPRGGRKEDITGIGVFYLDIDPIRPKDVSATPREQKRAVAKAVYILQNKIFREATLATSGNGAYLIFKLNIEKDLEEYEKRLKHLIKQIRKKYFPEGCGLRLDGTADLTRFMAVMGTKKMKGPDSMFRPHSYAQFLTGPNQKVAVSLIAYLDNMELPKPYTIYKKPDEHDVPESVQEKLNSWCQGWQRMYQTSVEEGERSDRYLNLVTKMVESDFSREQIHEAVLAYDSILAEPKILNRSSEQQKAVIDSWIFTAQDRIPYCQLVKKSLGKDACAGCKEIRYPSGGNYRLKEIEPLDNNEPRLELEQARKDIRNRLKTEIEGVVEAKKTNSPIPVIIVKSDPGVGKNQILSELIKKYRVAFYVQRLDDFEKVRKDLRRAKHEYRIIEINSKESLCRNSRGFKTYRNRGYAHREGETCRKCPDKAVCPYLNQFSKRDYSWILASKYLSVESIAAGNDPQIVILDELVLGDLIETRTFSLEDCVYGIEFIRSNKLTNAAWNEWNDAVKTI